MEKNRRKHALILCAPLLSSSRWDKYPRLHEITVPVLLTCGDMDEAGVKTLKDFQMAFPHAHLAVIPNASHQHHIERPQIYKSIISEFLKDK